MNIRISTASGLLALSLSLVLSSPALAQKQKPTTVAVPAQQFVTVQEPDAQRTKNEFSRLLGKYPPTVRGVFKQDPNLMTQEQYLAPYPALASYLTGHPEIAQNPAFYLDGLGSNDWDRPRENAEQAHASQITRMWDNFLRAVIVFAGFAMAIGLLTWLIRTFLDYRRWNRLSKVQSDVHTKLLDRFSSNEELMAYIATPAGSKFLQSAPISLDTGQSARAMAAPLSRIMLSLQAGVVLVAAGLGLMFASGRMTDDSYLPLEVMGILAVALGVGFAVSAGVSFLMSQRMGLLDPAPSKRSAETTEAQ